MNLIFAVAAALTSVLVTSNVSLAQSPLPNPGYSVFAHDCGTRVFQKTYLGFIADEFTVSNTPPVTCADALAVDRLTDQVFKMAKGFPIGKPNLFLVRQSNNGEADIDLHIGMNISPDSIVQNPDSQGMVVHELGHFLLRWFLSTKDRNIKIAFDADYVDSLFNYEDAYVSLLRAQNADPAVIASEIKYQSSLANLDDGMTDDVTEVVAKLDTPLTAMSELFADTIAVLYYNDPAINAKAILPMLKDPNLFRLYGRDFSDARNTLENMKAYGAGDPHTLLSPVRYALYLEYFQKGNFDPYLANRMANAIASILAEYEISTPLDEINTLFLNTLKAQLIPR